MKKLSWIAFLLAAVMIFGAFPVQADTLTDRLDVIEGTLGMNSGSDVLTDRLEYLEMQLGITGQEVNSVIDRIANLEDVLGITSAPATQPTSYNNINKQPETSLRDLDYFTSDMIDLDVSDLWLEDNYGGKYAHGISSTNSDPAVVEYQLNGQYSELAGTLYVAVYAVQNGHDFQWNKFKFSVYADDTLIYTVSDFDEKTEPLSLLLDVRGVQFLKLKFEGNYCYDWMPMPMVVLGNPVLDPVSTSKTSYDNGMYREEISLNDLSYFQMDGMVWLSLSDSYYEDNYGTKYAYAFSSDDTDPSSVEYQIGGDYTEFYGTIYIASYAVQYGNDFQWDKAKIQIYGDDVLLYTITATNMNEKSYPVDFSIDITGVRFLKIAFDGTYCYNMGPIPFLIIGNPTLAK